MSEADRAPIDVQPLAVPSAHLFAGEQLHCETFVAFDQV